MVTKILLPSLLLMSSMTVGAQSVSVKPADGETTHNDQFYIGSAAYVTFDGNKVTITPAEGKGGAQTYTLSETPTTISFSDKEVVPVKLREVAGLTYAATSFVAPETIDLTQMTVESDLTAYFATDIKEESVNLAPVTVIGKEQASMLRGDAGWYCLPVNKSAALPSIPNMFQGSLTDSYKVKATDNIYAFSISMANFCQIDPNVTIPAGKAYLVAPKSSGSTLSLNFNDLYDEETAAKTVTVADDSDAVRYNVAGQRVNGNANGIIISKGIKTIIK